MKPGLEEVAPQRLGRGEVPAVVKLGPGMLKAAGQEEGAFL